jgi:hypothetical protein
MLATVGKGLEWVNTQAFAHLPSGWSVLYQLAQLSRSAFEHLLQEGSIHPKMTLREARELLARFKGRRIARTARQTGLQHRLRQLRLYVRRTLDRRGPKERQQIRKKLIGLLELIDAKGRGDVEQNRDRVQLASSPRRISKFVGIAAVDLSERPATTV